MACDERVEARRSSIHGKGLFAGQRFRRGAYIATFEGTQTRRDGTHVLWVLDEDGNEMGIRGRNSLRYLNHSSRPNAEFRGADLHAVRNIQSGAEITFHYGDAWEDVE
jgi:SET domain-containing protein